MKHKLLAAITAILMCGTTFGTMSVNVSAKTPETKLSSAYRKKYKKILSETDYFQGVYIGDLVGDEREELVVATNEYGDFTVYVPVENRIVKYYFPVMSIWGFTKYNPSDRKFVCMHYYGHTTGAPHSLSMEIMKVVNNKVDVFGITKDWSDDGYSVESKINGKTVSDETFSLAINEMFVETARTEYIPFVKHNAEDMEEYEGEIIDIGYDEYIKKMLG